MPQTFQERLVQAMNLSNIKAADLAKRTGLSKAQISQYVNGIYQAKQNALYKLSVALDVSEAWLMGYDVPMERQTNMSPGEESLSEGEKLLIDLFRQVPENQQNLVLQMIRAAIESRE